MEANKYQAMAHLTARYKSKLYPYLALSEEVGEVNALVAKQLRKFGTLDDDSVRDKLKDELGDVLWNVAAIATGLGLSLDEVMQGNLDKLSGRSKEGTLDSLSRD